MQDDHEFGNDNWLLDQSYNVYIAQKYVVTGGVHVSGEQTAPGELKPSQIYDRHHGGAINN
jgi:hypothetical protein